MSKFYITTPIYYVNDKPHIGHAYTTISADVLARYHRLRGDEVFFLTGTDEHGSKVAQAAAKAGLEPQEFCDLNSAKFELLWDQLDITNDKFIRTTSQEHKDRVKIFLEKLKNNDAIYEGEYSGLYCNGCEKFISEKDLIDGKCPDHNCAPELLKEKNYFFKFKKYLPEVEKLIDSGQIKIMPESRRKEVLGLIKQGLDDFSISRESVKWGIELPFDKKQVVYVWVEALLNYITALGFGKKDNNLEKFWPAEIHLMAKDIIKFHALYWPALLVAAGLQPPKVIFAHGFFTVDGEKMSKTIGNTIDPQALLDEFGSDAVRYLLLSQFPFGIDGDVKAANFAIQYNADLANGVGNLVSRSIAMIDKYFAGQIPEPGFDEELVGQVEEIWQEYSGAMQQFAVDKAILAIKKLNALGDEYVEKNKPWQLAKNNQDSLSVVIYNLLEIIRHLALMTYQVMHLVSGKIFDCLGEKKWKNKKLEELKRWGGLTKDGKICKIEALFPRLEKKSK